MTDERLDRLDAPRTCTFCGAGVDPRLLAAVRERDELRDRLREAARIIETADQRAMATDGPVGHARDNMHDNEWRRLYLLVSDPRATAPSVEPDLMLHTQEADFNGVWCREDGQRWPCDIARAATPPVEPNDHGWEAYKDAFPAGKNVRRCSAIWNGCRCDRKPHGGDGHVWRNTLDGELVDPARYPSPDPVAGLRGQQAKFALHRFAKTTDEADEINRIVDALLASDKPGLDENPCCYSLHEFEQVCPRTGTTFRLSGGGAALLASDKPDREAGA